MARSIPPIPESTLQAAIVAALDVIVGSGTPREKLAALLATPSVGDGVEDSRTRKAVRGLFSPDLTGKSVVDELLGQSTASGILTESNGVLSVVPVPE